MSPISSRNTVPPSALWNRPAMVAPRAGEGALHVAEQFRFEQFGRDRAAVDRDEGLGVARAGAVDGARQQFLAGARFALDQQRCIALRGQPGFGQQRVHRRAGGDDFAAPVVVAGFGAAAGEPGGALQQIDQGGGVIGFGQVAEQPLLGGGHGVRNGAVRGQHDHRQRRVARMDGAKQRHAVHACHLHVGQHGVGARPRQLRQRRLAAVDRLDLEAIGFQPQRDQLAQCGVVVDHQNARVSSWRLGRRVALLQGFFQRLDLVELVLQFLRTRGLLLELDARLERFFHQLDQRLRAGIDVRPSRPGFSGCVRAPPRCPRAPAGRPAETAWRRRGGARLPARPARAAAARQTAPPPAPVRSTAPAHPVRSVAARTALGRSSGAAQAPKRQAAVRQEKRI